MNKRKNNNSPLKIAVLGHKTIPSRQGGIEIVVEELTVRMAKLGHKITVYNRSGHHVSGKEFDGKKLKEYKGIRMKYVPTIDKKGLAAMSASFFAAVAAAFGKYDVVHFHTLLGNGWSQYICTVIIVIVGASIFAITMQQIFNYISN